jgi:hypothetical protein
MAREPDPLLLELFESVQKELVTALEALERRRNAGHDMPAETTEEASRVGSLKAALASLEGALEIVQSRMVH